MALSVCVGRINPQGRELMDRASSMFPIACCLDDLSAAAVPWHWHDEMEAAVVTEGRAVVAVESLEVTLSPGDGFFINAGALHAAWEANASGARLHSVVFHPRLVGAGIDSVFHLRYVQPLLENKALKIHCFDASQPWHQDAARAIESAWQSCVNEPAGYEFGARDALSRLVFLLQSHYTAANAAPSARALRNDERLKQMLCFIHAQYDQKISASDIAAAASISVSESLRCFTQTIGVSPVMYLKQYRVYKAAERLRSGGEKAADIGSLCGFQDASYFTKAFREIKGCTPGAYRRRCTPVTPEESMCDRGN